MMRVRQKNNQKKNNLKNKSKLIMMKKPNH